MLEQLVISSGHRRESRKFRGFFLATAALVLTGCFSIFVWSIMAMELTLTDDGLELSTLIAPVPIPQVEPPKPEPPQQQQAQQPQQAVKNEIATRQSIIQRTDESPIVPDKISTAPMTQKARPANGIVRLSNGPETDATYGTGPRGDGNTGGPGGPPVAGFNTGGNGDDEIEKAPVMPKKEPEKPRKPVSVSGGVLNGQAKALPKPPYPAPAKLMNISDSVSVQVVVDEQGNVISAKAVSGHQMLRQAAEQAARQAKFGPTLLTGQPVKVTGVIIYKFSNG